MEYVIVLEKAKEGGYVVSCPALPGCFSQGETKEEAVANIKEAIECYLESLEKDNIQPQIIGKPELLSVKV